MSTLTKKPFVPIFILGAPRSGTTMLERMLSSNSRIKGGPEPHIVTPLAYLGYWGQVDKAPYDHIIASLGQKAFVEALPHKEQDYWSACRRYCDTLYGAYMEGAPEIFCLDKTPEYVTVWPFLTKVFPDAKYIVLTRHPGAILSSFANSFFDGDFNAAQEHDPVLERYIPALAGFLRQQEVPFFHLCYEELVSAPEEWMRKLCGFVDIPFEPEAIEYGGNHNYQAAKTGLGDPVGVRQYSRPTDVNMYKWVEEYVADEQKLQLLSSVFEHLDPEDLAAIGYTRRSFWEPIEAKYSKPIRKNKGVRFDLYRMQRKLIVKGRGLVQRSKRTRAVLLWFRLLCDVLLRKY